MCYNLESDDIVAVIVDMCKWQSLCAINDEYYEIITDIDTTYCYRLHTNVGDEDQSSILIVYSTDCEMKSIQVTSSINLAKNI